MANKKQNILDFGLLKDFFHFRPNAWIIVSSGVILGCIYLYFTRLHDIYIFPNRNNFTFEFYTDSANGGNSEIIQHNISDTAINFDFDLKEGFLSPYIGLCIRPRKDSTINLSQYNQFRIDIGGQKTKIIGVSLFTRNPYKRSTELCFHTNLEISSDRKQYHINLSQLKIPDWWREVNNIPPNEEIKPDLKNVLHFNIGTAYTSVLGTKRSLRIYSFSIERNNENLLLLLITAELIVLFLLVIIHYVRAYSKKKAIPVTIAYKPVDTKNEKHQLNDFLDYINHNFQDHDLSLEQISNYTGINQRRIASSIQQSFGCNFKTYVNQLRINESKRLLTESGLNMGEIAFKVGFSNQSHFNRVFKNLVGISPSEFRESRQ